MVVRSLKTLCMLRRRATYDAYVIFVLCLHIHMLWCIVLNHCSLMILHEAGCFIQVEGNKFTVVNCNVLWKNKSVYKYMCSKDVKSFCNLGRREQKLAVSWILEE